MLHTPKCVSLESNGISTAVQWLALSARPPYFICHIFMLPTSSILPFSLPRRFPPAYFPHPLHPLLCCVHDAHWCLCCLCPSPSCVQDASRWTANMRLTANIGAGHQKTTKMKYEPINTADGPAFKSVHLQSFKYVGQHCEIL